jgi:hypothetical protein
VFVWSEKRVCLPVRRLAEADFERVSVALIKTKIIKTFNSHLILKTKQLNIQFKSGG